MEKKRALGTGKTLCGLMLIAALAAGFGLWLGQPRSTGPSTQPPAQNMRLLDAPRALPEFTLLGSDGRSIDKATLAGHYTLAFLGFTHCPDVCPTTLQELAAAEKLWADLPEAQRPRILFISADPERDTPEQLGQYVGFFSPTMLAGTGNAAALTRLTAPLKMVFAKVPLGNGNYSIDHTSWVAVLDPQTRLIGRIHPPLNAATIASDMKLLMESRG